MQKIKIISNYSGPGGSTVAHAGLVNLFNMEGYDCTFYGPHSYHMTLCKGGFLSNVTFDNNDIIIAHFLPNITIKPPVKKIILSLHEKELFPLKKIKYDIYDRIHYIRESQRIWHGIDHPYFICPNIHTNLQKNKKPNQHIAGIVGNIDPNKQVHISIQRALKDGCSKVFLFGRIHDQHYYDRMVLPLIDNKRVLLPVFVNDKQKIYDSIDRVYLSSKSEVCPYVQGEAMLTGTEFFGVDYMMDDPYIIKNENEILSIWEDIFNN